MVQASMLSCRVGIANVLLGNLSKRCIINRSKVDIKTVGPRLALPRFTKVSYSITTAAPSSSAHTCITKRFYTKASAGSNNAIGGGPRKITGPSNGKLSTGKRGGTSETSNAIVRNESINFPRMRVVWVDVGTKESKWEIMTREGALALAKKMSMDLILVNRLSDPPVCRVESFSKIREEAKAKEKKKLVSGPKAMKEMYVGAGIEKHDLTTKMNKVIEMLAEFHPVKIQISATKAILDKNPLAMEEVTLRVLEMAESHVGSVQQSRIKHGKKEFILNPKLKKDDLAPK